ncbi:MAG TPA: LemA family protein [Anaerohalosphaeraceae bacterium]|nr:LemA family protein [Anaerohalosphaeraceae bacterium]HPP56825.1 LemA family protein [Anaerohalosphaeraceae bacterium]
MCFLLFVLPAFLLLIFVIGGYNSLISKRNQIRNIFGTMDAMLKKRWDLVPNLVAAVKGYAEHERQLFEKVSELRAKALSGALSTEQKVNLDNLMTQLVGVVRGVAERYPDLKASENFLHLQRTLNELEEQISAARRAFNAAVTDYNNTVQMFPTNLLATLFGFERQELFQIEASEREVPSASFGQT